MILLSGANGFLGAHLAFSLLEKGHTVRAMKRAGSSTDEFEFIRSCRNIAPELLDKLHWVEADILDYDTLTDAMQGIDTVFHCAATVSFWPKKRDQMYRTNVEGTANMVNAALASGVNRFIHTSSIAAVGRDEKNREITEESTWVESPLNSHYAISKRLAEMEVWRGREEGLKVSMVNPGVILGEGDWSKGSCRLLKKIASGMPYYTSAVNGYVDVLDVAEAMIRLYEKEIDGERFILVGENCPAKELITDGAALFGHKPPGIHVKPWMLHTAALISGLASRITGKEPLVTKETARTASHVYYYDSGKARRVLGMELANHNQILKRVKPFLKP